MSPIRLHVLLAGAGIALAMFVWLSLAPVSLGGSVRYLVVSGDSMSPQYEDGDLILVRSSAIYAPGAVIAYRHPELGVIVHRIVGQDGQRFLVKGDNNDLADEYRPAGDEILGAAWVDLPNAGRWIERLRTPWIAVLAAGASGLLALVPLGIGLPIGDRSWIRRSRANAQPAPRLNPDRLAGLLGPLGQALILLLTVLAVSALILALLAFNRPTDRIVSEATGFEQRAGLAYTAIAAGNVYAQGVVVAGDPIYLALVDEVTIHLDYEIDSSLEVTGHGAHRISAQIQRSDGWRSSIPLQPETPFVGTRFATAVPFQLNDIDAAIADFETQAGIEQSPTEAYAVRIVADIFFDGMVGEAVIHEFTGASLTFDLTGVALRLADSSASNPPGESATVKAGAVNVERESSNSVGLGFMSLDVRSARIAAQAGLLLAVLGGAVLTLLMRKALSASEPAQIAARYRARIIPIQGAKIPSPTRVIAVTSFDDLLRVADLKQEPILYFARDGVHFYFIQVADVIYRRRVESDARPAEIAKPDVIAVERATPIGAEGTEDDDG